MYIPTISLRHFEPYRKSEYSGDVSDAFKLIVNDGLWHLGIRVHYFVATELTIDPSVERIVYAYFAISPSEEVTVHLATESDYNTLATSATGYRYHKLGKVTSNSDSIILIEDAWEGGDIFSSEPLSTDGLSIELNSSGALQIHNYNDGAPVDTTSFPAGSLIPYHDANLSYVCWVSPFYAVQSIASWAGIDLQGASWTSPPWEVAGTILHNKLSWTEISDVRASAQGNRDHDYRHPVQGAAYNTNGGAAAFQSIGYAAANPAHATALLRIELQDCKLVAGTSVYVDWDGMLLQNAGNTRINWGLGLAYDAANKISFDWFDYKLKIDNATRLDWDDSGHVSIPHAIELHLLDDTGVPVTMDAGTLKITGGFLAQGACGIGTATDFCWFMGSGAPAYICVHSSTMDVQLIGTTYAVNAVGKINSSTGYYINDVQGKTCDGFAGGILTTTVVAKQNHAVQPDDYMLCFA